MDFPELSYWLAAINEYNRAAIDAAGGGN